jgi:hypothetical protein
MSEQRAATIRYRAPLLPPTWAGRQAAEILLAQHQQLVSRKKEVLDAAEKALRGGRLTRTLGTR